jgi:hypothetical protein
MLVVVPAAQVDRVTLAGGLGHAHHVHEEVEALVGFGCVQLEVPEMSEIKSS